MSVKITKNQRILLEQMKFEAKNPQYAKQKQKADMIKLNQSLHGLNNHLVDDKIKTRFQQEVYKLLKPIVYENKVGKTIYKRNETIRKLYGLIKLLIDYGTTQETFEIFELISYIENSEEERKTRNRKRKHNYDPRKDRHNIARNFISDLVNLFYYIFSERKQLF